MEIEAKFTFEAPNEFEALKKALTLAGRRLRPREEVRLRDKYFDTVDGSLYAKGYALRERSGGNGVLITLKSLSETKTLVKRREEVETRLETGCSIEDLTSGAVRRKLNKLIGEKLLITLVELEQERQTIDVKDGRRIIAEISLDKVHVDTKENSNTYLELEVELRKSGTEEELIEILTDLQREWLIIPEHRSKYIRALETTGHKLVTQPQHDSAEKVEKPPKAPGILSDDSFISAAQKTLKLHFLHMCFNEPGTRLGEDIEALHDMRVATRRMRAAFNVFDGFLPSIAAKPLLKGLKKTGRTLGAVRDLDVFWEKTTQYQETLPVEEKVDLSALRIAWEKQGAFAKKKLITYLDSVGYRQFKERFQVFLNDRKNWIPPDLAREYSPRPHLLQHVVPVAVYQRLADVQAYDQWVSGPAVPVERLHQLRIAAKRLRYTLEFFREVLGPEAELLIKRIKSLQDHLGDLQDAVVAEEILESFLIWGTWGAGRTISKDLPQQPTLLRDAGVSTYLAARRREIDILIETFPQVWVEIRDPYFSHSIAAMLTVW